MITTTLFDGISERWQYEDIDSLTAYLNKVWQERPLHIESEQEEEKRSNTNQRFFILDKDSIEPKNYIGFVQHNDLRINVYPRVFHQHPSFNPTVAIQHVMKWLSYSKRIHFPFNEVPQQLDNCDDWLEALIFLFSNYSLDVLSTSPHFAYHEVTEEMSFVRGRIAMQSYINENLTKGRHHLIHCTYEPFLYDNLFNRIVKHTCRLLQSVTQNAANKHLLSDILFLLDGVSDTFCTAEDCNKVAVNRLYPEIGVISNMCASFLSNRIYNGNTANNQNLCILLPMEVIYEQYVAGFLQYHFPYLKARPQASDEYVAKTGEDFATDVFRMKHDILLPDKMIIDTKYKFRYLSDDNKGYVSQSDVYQMVTYLYKRHMKDGLLLYPKHFDSNASNEEHQFKINDLFIAARSLDVTESDLNLFEDSQVLKFKEAIANYL